MDTQGFQRRDEEWMEWLPYNRELSMDEWKGNDLRHPQCRTGCDRSRKKYQ